jgi:hypothetical protein
MQHEPHGLAPQARAGLKFRVKFTVKHRAGCVSLQCAVIEVQWAAT